MCSISNQYSKLSTGEIPIFILNICSSNTNTGVCKAKYKNKYSVQEYKYRYKYSVRRYNSNVIRLANNSLVDTRGLYQVHISVQVEMKIRMHIKTFHILPILNDHSLPWTLWRPLRRSPGWIFPSTTLRRSLMTSLSEYLPSQS